MKKIGVLFGCEIYKAHFYRPRDFVFLSKNDFDKLKTVEAAFLEFISAVNAQIKKPEP